MPGCGQGHRPFLSAVSEDSVNFYRLREGDDPSTGERDDDSVLFGQGRSMERQQRDAKGMSIIGIVLAVTMAGAVVCMVL